MHPFSLSSLAKENLETHLDLPSGTIDHRPRVERRLSDLKGCFRNHEAYEEALQKEDALIYAVTSVEPATGDGQMHYGLGILYPGKIGNEYYLTKGHLHAHRVAAEVYVGLQGEGQMLLEEEGTRESRLLPFGKNTVVYVPGHTAHRTINTGSDPLVYLGIYPSHAGHDYLPIAQKNFRMVVVEKDHRSTMEIR